MGFTVPLASSKGVVTRSRLEEGRVLNVGVPLLPEGATQTKLPGLAPAEQRAVAVLVQRAVDTGEIRVDRTDHGGPEAAGLRQQGQRAVAPIAVAHHAEALRIGNTQINQPVDGRQHQPRQLAERVAAALRIVPLQRHTRIEDGKAVACQELPRHHRFAPTEDMLIP